MDYLDRPLKKNPDGTIPFGRPAIKRPTPEFLEGVREARELGKKLGFADEYEKMKATESQ
jgi:hypothetical protein